MRQGTGPNNPAIVRGARLYSPRVNPFVLLPSSLENLIMSPGLTRVIVLITANTCTLIYLFVSPTIIPCPHTCRRDDVLSSTFCIFIFSFHLIWFILAGIGSRRALCLQMNKYKFLQRILFSRIRSQNPFPAIRSPSWPGEVKNTHTGLCALAPGFEAAGGRPGDFKRAPGHGPR